MRNSWNSWDKSDSHGCYMACGNPCEYPMSYCIGKNDLSLMQRLVKAGTDHSKFMRMITVTCDITAPLYFFKQFSTYSVGVVELSTSTMHTITNKEITKGDFSWEYIEKAGGDYWMNNTISFLNEARDLYNNFDEYYKNGKIVKEAEKKVIWNTIIQALPSSYNQLRTVQLNYQVLRHIYHSRKNHRLDEWKSLCDWIEHLPYSELITEV